MRILIDEEYGYRHWEWIPHVNAKCALKEFLEGIDANQFADIYNDITLLGGMWRELRPKKDATDEELDYFYSETLNRDKYDACGHLHELHDSYVCFRAGENETEWLYFGKHTDG